MNQAMLRRTPVAHDTLQTKSGTKRLILLLSSTTLCALSPSSVPSNSGRRATIQSEAMCTTRVLGGLRVYPERMRANVDALQGLMMSEAVMFALGQAVGRQTAHDVVYACAMRAVETKRPFREVLAEDPLVRAHLSDDDLDRLLDPTRYIGLAREMVDQVCRAAAE